MEHQATFFPSADTISRPPPAALAGTAPSLTAEIATLWGLPLDHRVQVTLRNHPLTSTVGRLELSRLPDLPLDSHAALALRIGKDEFSNRQIIAWSLAD
jgi:hypothetical protein